MPCASSGEGPQLPTSGPVEVGGEHRERLPDRGQSANLTPPEDPGTGKGGRQVETYNVYMDESPAGGDTDGEEGYEVEFRVVPNSSDDGDPENNAVLAGLDLVDLINLRDALQQEIDNYAHSALEAQNVPADDGEELMP